MSIKYDEDSFLEEVRTYFKEKKLEDFLKKSIEKAIKNIPLKDHGNKLSLLHNTANQKPSLEDYLFYDKSAITIRKRIIRLQIRDSLTRDIREIYGPMPDIALAPFNLKEKTAINMSYVCRYVENEKIMKSWIKELKQYYRENVKRYPEYRSIPTKVTPLERNPRCFIAIEICFTGSRKHTLGSMVNASILGYYGILVTRGGESEKGVKLKDALKLKQYLLKIQELKAPGRIAINTLIVMDEQFIKSIRKISAHHNTETVY